MGISTKLSKWSERISNMKYSDFENLMNKYIRYAGKWHEAGCNFVYNDRGVCKCKVYENEGKIKEFINKIIK